MSDTAELDPSPTQRVARLFRSTPPAAPPALHALAAAVRKPAALQAAEKRLAEARRQRGEVVAEQREILSKVTGSPQDDRLRQRVAELSKTERSLSIAATEARAERAAALPAYEAAVRAALAPRLVEVSADALSALETLRASIAVAAAAEVEMQHAGVLTVRRFPLNELAEIEAIFQRMAAAAGG